MIPKKFNPTTSDAIINGTTYQMIAFYYPGHNTSWDDYYNAFFLGNFYKTQITLTINGITATFHTSEAAFQCTKWWSDDSIRKQFENAPDGNAAFQISKTNRDTADGTYAGLYRDKAMLTVLKAKFSDTDLQQGLLDTNAAYLLEHNQKHGLDHYWSDDNDGTGLNNLGKTLMEVRSFYGGSPSPCSACSVKDFTLQVQAK